MTFVDSLIFTLRTVSKQRSHMCFPLVLKVIQGPLPGFSGKSWRMRMQLMLDPFFPAWGLVPRSAASNCSFR